MFMHEFKTLKTASSMDQLRASLKVEDFDRFGEPFTPEFVYEAIRQLPRFASMRVCDNLRMFNCSLTSSSAVISKMLRSFSDFYSKA